jgi:hypothetical protein
MLYRPEKVPMPSKFKGRALAVAFLGLGAALSPRIDILEFRGLVPFLGAISFRAARKITALPEFVRV